MQGSYSNSTASEIDPVSSFSRLPSKYDLDIKRGLDVSIFGGFGMTASHCRRVGVVYGDLGIQNAKVWRRSLPEMTIPKIGDRVARRVAGYFNAGDMNMPHVIHLFSGSVFLFCRILANFTEAARQSIAGVVFECSPMDCQAEQFGRFLSWRLKRDYSKKYALPFQVLRPIMGITREFEESHYKLLLQLPNHANVHFIHCEDDPIVSYDYIDTYRQNLAARGHRTSLTIHQQARHCMAVADRKIDYHNDVQGFLKNVLHEG